MQERLKEGGGEKGNYSQCDVALIVLLPISRGFISIQPPQCKSRSLLPKGRSLYTLKTFKTVSYHYWDTSHLQEKSPSKAVWVLPDNKHLPSDVFLTLFYSDIWYYQDTKGSHCLFVPSEAVLIWIRNAWISSSKDIYVKEKG